MFSMLRAMIDVTLFLQCLLVLSLMLFQNRTFHTSELFIHCMTVYECLLFFSFCDCVVCTPDFFKTSLCVCLCVFPRSFGKTWGWINDDRIFILWVNYPFKTFYKHLVVWGSTLLTRWNTIYLDLCVDRLFFCLLMQMGHEWEHVSLQYFINSIYSGLSVWHGSLPSCCSLLECKLCDLCLTYMGTVSSESLEEGRSQLLFLFSFCFDTLFLFRWPDYVGSVTPKSFARSLSIMSYNFPTAAFFSGLSYLFK